MKVPGTVNTKSEASIQRNEADMLRRLRDRVVQSCANGIIITDALAADNPIIYANDAFFQLTGYSRGEVLGKNPRFLQGPDDNSSSLEEMHKAIQERRGCTILLSNYKKDQTPYWIELTLSPILDSEGKLSHYAGIYTDVSNRIYADEKIRATSSRLSSLIENFHAGVLVEDEHRRIVLANHEFCRLFHVPVSPEMLIGGDCEKAAEESKKIFTDPDAFTSRVSELLHHQTACSAELIAVADGRIFERDYIPIFVEKNYRGHMWIYRDVTSKKLAEETLKNVSEQRKELIISAQELVATLSVKEISEKLAERLRQLFHYDTLALYVAVHETNTFRPLFVKGADWISDDIDRWAIPMDAGIVGSVVLSMKAERIDHAERDPRSVYPLGTHSKCEHLMVFPMAVSGQLVGIFLLNRLQDPGFSDDEFQLTEILLAYTSLALQNAQYVEQLKESEKRKELILQQKEEFFARMSHEIRTPMNGIIGMTNLLLQSNLRAEQLILTKNLKFSTDNLLVIINDILDIEKIEAGMIRLEKIDFTLKECIETAILSVQSTVDEKGLILSAKFAEGLPGIVIGDPVRLNQILLNLLTNAIKFTEQGSIGVDVICVKEEGENSLIKISVTDTGCGISHDNVQKLFQKFVQVHHTVSQKTIGTGLGLSIVKQLTELQGGSVGVTSTVGAGSVFSVQIPFKKSSLLSIASSAAAIVRELIPLNGVSVLVVEDNPMNQRVAQLTLERWNTAVDIAGNGEIALEMISKKKYDLIFMDIQMPGMDGYETTRMIREFTDPLTASVPIIAMTASVLDDAKNKVLKAGMNDYIPKPFNPDHLYAVMTKYIDPLIYSTRNDSSFKNIPHPAVQRLTDLDYLLRATDNDEQAIISILTTYIESVTGYISELGSAVKKTDREQIVFLAHKLKSMTKMVGMDAASNEADNLEEAARTGAKIDTIVEMSEYLLSACALSLDELKERINEMIEGQKKSDPSLRL